MKKIPASLKMLFIIGALTVGFNACEKDMTTNVSDTKNMSGPESAAMANQNSDDISSIVDEAYTRNSDPSNRTSGDNSSALVLSSCAKVTVDMITNPHVITVDFGATNCLGKDGHNRRGMIIATFNGAYHAEGTVMNFTTVNYYLDNNKVDAAIASTNLGRNSNGYLHFSVSGNSTITLGSNTPSVSAGTMVYGANRDQEWVVGEATATPWDDVYLVRGTSHITAVNKAEYNTEITTALRKEVGYRFFVAGVEKITPVLNTNLSATLDYGYPNGARDNLALAKFSNGQTAVIHLK